MWRVLLIILLVPISATAQELTIGRFFAESEFNARYILSQADQLVPIGRPINKKTIDCLVTSLKQSRMFRELEYELVDPDQNKWYTLVLKPKFNGDPDGYRIKKVRIGKFPGIGRKATYTKLFENGVRAGVPFMPYTRIERAIVEAVRGDYDRESGEPPRIVWVNARLLSDGISVVLDIESQAPKCGG